MRRRVLRAERGDDKARVGSARGPLGLGYDPALAAPAVARRPLKLLETTRRLAAGFALFLGSNQFTGNLGDQSLVLGQPEQKIDAIGLAPTHQGVAGKPRIGPQHDAHFGPLGADLRDDARRLLDRAGGRVDVGAALFCR